ATIAENLADFTGRVEPGTAYTAGIIHDIGKVVIDQYVASAYPYFYRNLQEEKTFLQIERQLFGIDHTEVGSYLAEKWSFPDSLVNIISHHHYPEKSTQNQELTHIVYLADLLMSRFNTGLEMERMNTDALVSRLEKVGLSPSKFPEIVDSIPHEALGPSPELAINA
ncbi:MAG: HDOD domain-containing protein, partial [Thermodesulfobacteriota bacterium]|nr:HDOD domain-containing protein [Thermodesulfobacteriota bacterium]